MKKYIFLSIIIAILSIFNFTSINAINNTSSNVVWPYNSASECTKVRNENENNSSSDYQKYERSKCYLNNWKYQYNICKKWEGCINTSSVTNNVDKINSTSPILQQRNPYANKKITIKGKNWTIESFFWKKIDILIKRITSKGTKANSLKKLIYFKDRLTKIWNLSKFKNNKLVQNLVWYIKFEVLEEVAILKREIAIEEENNWLDNFICELEWNCDKPIICTREYRPVCAQPKMPTCPKW